MPPLQPRKYWLLMIHSCTFLWTSPGGRKLPCPILLPFPRASCIQLSLELRIGKSGCLALIGTIQRGIPAPELLIGLAKAFVIAVPQFSSPTCPFLLSLPSCGCFPQDCSPSCSEPKSLAHSCFQGM